VAKSRYSEKLKKKQQFSTNDPASVWTGLRTITKYKSVTIPPICGESTNG